MDHRDDLLDRVIDELRVLPPADEASVSRIVAAAQAAGRDDESEVAAPRPVRPTRRWLGPRGMPYAWAAGMALAAGIGGFMIGGTTADERAPAPAIASATSAAQPTAVTPAANVPGEMAARHTQFVLEAPNAASVSLVGDFNGWDATVTPLVRDARSGLWSATIALVPGRHNYAFIVDSVLTLDPSAPKAADRDLGTESSVVLVGAP